MVHLLIVFTQQEVSMKGTLSPPYLFVLCIERLAYIIEHAIYSFFWQDKWVKEFPFLANFNNKTLNKNELNLKVSAMKLSNGDGDRANLENELLILATPPPNWNVGRDWLVWMKSKSYTFSVKDAYNIVYQETLSAFKILWNKIWDWSGLQIIKTFMWLAINDKLHTNASRFHRFMTQNPYSIPGVQNK